MQSLHFELLINALAQILTELWRFKKIDLLFILLTRLFDLWPSKTTGYFPLPWYICEAILVAICQSVCHITCNIQTDKQTNRQTVISHLWGQCGQLGSNPNYLTDSHGFAVVNNSTGEYAYVIEKHLHTHYIPVRHLRQEDYEYLWQPF